MDHRSPRSQDPRHPRRPREDEQLYSEQGQREFDPGQEASDKGFDSSRNQPGHSPINERYRIPDRHGYESEPQARRHAGESDGNSRMPGMQQGNQPASGASSFRGRGPKEFQRSDERLQEIICERLTDDPRIDATDVDVKVQGRAVTVSGKVADRRQKYMIEDLVEDCHGVSEVHNELRVEGRAPGRDPGQRDSADDGHRDDGSYWRGTFDTREDSSRDPSPSSGFEDRSFNPGELERGPIADPFTRSGGFSGFGSRSVPGQITGSMALGNEGGWASGTRLFSNAAHSDTSLAGRTMRGRGPKGFERSDERLLEAVCETLTEDPHIDASEVTVAVKDKVVTLTGTVSDRRQKYLIEEVVEECHGVSDVRNELRIRRGDAAGQSSFSQLPKESPT